ncbi:MAG: FtsX-like permease family protein [Alphaproteobacteria bacterium]|nr:FtsX-like permease family protein [Alphaproteobacteria bacterium]
MPLHIAWRILAHQKGRTALALGGIFIAILLIFVELGFFIAVPQGGMLIYDHMRFDLLMASNKYIFQGQSWQFPRQRLDEVGRNAGVAQINPVYFGGAKWQDPSGGLRIDISVIGFDPKAKLFAGADGDSQIAILERPDTVLVDSQTRPIFGPLQPGRVVDVNGRRITIGGEYVLGTGFLGLGIALASEANFFRIFPNRPPQTVSFGLVTLKPGADPDAVARELRAALPNDTRVFTRPELAAHEVSFWTTRTGTGLIFGSGLIVAFIVGIMVLYQTLATQITRQLPQFATLKAIGYSNGFLNGIVLIEAVLVMLIAFVPALAAALGIYSVVRAQTLLPVNLTALELGGVFAVTLAMAVISALLSVGRLRRADPAEVF